MPSRIARGTQLALQLAAAVAGGGILAAQEPFAIGVVDAATEAQPPFNRTAGIATRFCLKPGLVIEQLGHQPPGPRRRRLLQGPLVQTVPLRQGKGLEQGSGLLQPRRGGNARHSRGQQHLGGLAATSLGDVVLGQLIQSHAGGGGAVRGLFHRQQHGLEASRITGRQPPEGLGGAAVIQASVGGAPLQQEPLLPFATGSGSEAIQHRQSLLGGPAADQHMGVGQHHRQGLRRRMEGHQAGVKLAHPRIVPQIQQGETGLLDLLEAALLQQQGKDLGRVGLGRHPRGGSSGRAGGRRAGSGRAGRTDRRRIDWNDRWSQAPGSSTGRGDGVCRSSPADPQAGAGQAEPDQAGQWRPASRHVDGDGRRGQDWLTT